MGPPRDTKASKESPQCVPLVQGHRRLVGLLPGPISPGNLADRASGALTPNKWFKADYAEALRTTLRRRTRVQLLVDFGHSRVLFPDADTFPAAVVLQPAMFAVPDTEMFHFVRAHDEDRERYDLADLLRQFAVSVPHANLRAERWHLEESGASDLLDRLLSTGTTLLRYVGRSPTYGVKTGFNEAFYLDSATETQLCRQILPVGRSSGSSCGDATSTVGRVDGTASGTFLSHRAKTTHGHGLMQPLTTKQSTYSQRNIPHFTAT